MAQTSYYTDARLRKLFEKALYFLLEHDKNNIINKVSERCLCGNLAIHLSNIIHGSFYDVDIEYNRNIDAVKRLGNGNNITCDLLLHKRGDSSCNMIVVEMKIYGHARNDDIERDKARLREMTSLEGLYNYKLGVYVEINQELCSAYVEYYLNGNLDSQYTIPPFP